MVMIQNDEKPDNLNVRRGAEREYHFHYRREERLQRQAALDPGETVRRKRNRFIGKWLLIGLAVAIVALVGLFMFRFFFP